MSKTDIIDRLLETDGYIIDFLPMAVQRDGAGQFFEVEEYLLGSEKYVSIKERFVSVILKLMCYYHTAVLQEKWIDRPSPGLMENLICQMSENTFSGTLNILFPEEDMLLVFDRDCLNLSVYNPPQKVQPVMEKIAFSEGLFWREACCSASEM